MGATVRNGLAAQIRLALEQEIESGTLAPGYPLDERALAARFDVSRTPIREALQQLAAKELVVIVPRQGVYVSRLSIPQLRAILELLGELEALCAKLSARRIDDQNMALINKARQQCVDSAAVQDPVAYGLANAQFHEAVYQACRNQYLADQVRGIRRLIRRYNVNVFKNSAQLQKSLEQHQEIADAIFSGREQDAYEAMLRHIPVGTTGFSEFLSGLPDSFFANDSAPNT